MKTSIPTPAELNQLTPYDNRTISILTKQINSALRTEFKGTSLEFNLGDIGLSSKVEEELRKQYEAKRWIFKYHSKPAGNEFSDPNARYWIIIQPR